MFKFKVLNVERQTSLPYYNRSITFTGKVELEEGEENISNLLYNFRTECKSLECREPEPEENIIKKDINEHIEMMAAAFLKVTNIKADEAEMVVQHTDDGVKYYFRRR